MENAPRILMLIWEFPPKISGGLGMAGAGLVKALSTSGIKVDVLLPRVDATHEPNGARLIDASELSIKEDLWQEETTVTETLRQMEFGSHLVPYLPPQEFQREVISQRTTTVEQPTKEREAAEGIELDGEYNEGIVGQVHKYALLAYQLATSGQYDLIHAHDWMTFPAGTLIQESSSMPVVFHVHSLESDRNGIYGNEEIAKMEHDAMSSARYIVAVSDRVRNSIVTHHGVNADRIEVIPNAVEHKFIAPHQLNGVLKVGFVGRLTHQKGPNYYLDIVKELKSRLPAASFEVIGDGYLLPELKKKAHHLNLSQTVHFYGFLPHAEVMKKMKEFQLLIVPSVSEPFGLVILEAIANGVPVVTSPHTGIAEFVSSLPQVDNWNIYELTQVCYRLLTDASFRAESIGQCQKEARSLSWAKAAKRLAFLYQEIVSR